MKVKSIHHYRIDEVTGELKEYRRSGPNARPFVPAQHGGMTVVLGDYNQDGDTPIGIAGCSTKDNFCYRLGRTIAIGRALDVSLV